MKPKDRIEKALAKPAQFGPDIDLTEYELERPRVEGDLSILDDRKLQQITTRVGIPTISRLGYIQVDEKAYFKMLENVLGKYGVKVLPLQLALKRLDLPRELSWRLIDPETDKYTAAAYLYGGELGYFIYIPPNTKVPIPIYTCLALISDKRIQFTHNVVYVSENSEAHLVTGCAVPHGLRGGVHIGISEFFVGKNAKLTFSMIHAWTEGVHVRPRTAVRVEEGGEYVSYYVIYSPVASVQAYPSVSLGKGARAYMATIVAGAGSGVYDVGSRTILEGNGASSEIVSRTVASDNSKIYARAEIIARESQTRGHIECLGLLLSDRAYISSTPIITSEKPGAVLSHEAAIGVIAEEELEYLMSKGFTESEARAIIVRGFMSIEAPGIPLSVKLEVNKILDMVAKYAVG